MPEDEKKVASRRPSSQSTSEALISEKRNAGGDAIAHRHLIAA
jgi:hypothetical protein